MKAMAFEVSWSSKTTGAVPNKLQDRRGKETFAQSLKESGLGDPKRAQIKTATKMTGQPVIEGNVKKDVTGQGAFVMQGKDMVAGPKLAGKTPDKEESDEAGRVVRGEVKLSTIPSAASREHAEKEIADVPKSGSTTATKETSIAKLKKQGATKSVTGVVTDATQIAEPGSMQISTAGEETAALQCSVAVGTQLSVSCGGALEDGSGTHRSGASGSQAIVNGVQRGSKGAEIGKTRLTKFADENPLGADPKNALAKDIAEAEKQKSSGETAVDPKELPLGSTASSAKIEAEASGGMAVAIQHVAGSLIPQDNAGTPRYMNMIQGANPGAGQARELEATALPASHDPGYWSNYGSGPESGPALLATTPTALEIGMASGTHGWLKIRAEIEDGVVTASLSARSTAAQEMLHHELPSLTAFLHEEMVGVSAVTVRHASSAGTEGMSYGSGMQHQGRSAQQNPGGGGDDTPAGSSERVWGLGDQVAMHEMWQDLRDGAAFLPAMTAGSGGWLNVRV